MTKILDLMKAAKKEKKQKEDKEKEEKEKLEVKKKVCFDVKVEVISPITVRYRVWAFDAKEAAEEVKKGRARPVFISKPIIHKERIKSLVVYLAGTVNKLFSFER